MPRLCPLWDDCRFPLLVQPDAQVSDVASLADWFREQPSVFQPLLVENGAMRFGGFGIDHPEAMARLHEAAGLSLMPYP